MPQQPIRAGIRRYNIPDALYFVTAVAHERQPVFAEDGSIALLRKTHAPCTGPPSLRDACGMCFCRITFTLLIHIPDATSISRVMHWMQRNSTLNYKRAHVIERQVAIWQRGFWDHVIRDDVEWVNHLHYIHFNPVKHGYVSRPEDYPHSSFQEYVRRGWYEAGWGHVEPEVLRGLDFE